MISPPVVSRQSPHHQLINMSPIKVIQSVEEPLFNKGPHVSYIVLRQASGREIGWFSWATSFSVCFTCWTELWPLPSNPQQVTNSRHRGLFLGLTTHTFCNEPQLGFCCVGEADWSPVSGRFSLPIQHQGESELSVFVQQWPASLCTLRANDRSLKRQREDGTGRAEAEETRALLDLLRCPHSPWHQDHTWSPQAASLRELAVQAPQRLHANFVYTFFTTLRVLEKGVSFVSIFGGVGGSTDLNWNQWFCDVAQLGTLMWIFRIEHLSSNPSCFKSVPVFPVQSFFFVTRAWKSAFIR